MRKVFVFTAVTMAGAAMPAKAQVMVDMSLVTCRQYLESDPDRQGILAAWMGGYFSATKNLSTVDLRYTERNIKVVTKYCKSHKKETLMKAVQKNFR